MKFLGKGALDRALAEYVEHYHDERCHQGIGNEIESGAVTPGEGDVVVSERLGGLLH